MTMRTQRQTVTFNLPFKLKAFDRILPPGTYEVVIDEELIEGLSFLAYRRVATAIIVPAESHEASAIEMVVIDPLDLRTAQQREVVQERDTAPRQAPRAAMSPPGGGS